MNQLHNEPNPFNKHTMVEFKRKMHDVDVNPEKNNAEIDDLIRKNKEYEAKSFVKI